MLCEEKVDNPVAETEVVRKDGANRVGKEQTERSTLCDFDLLYNLLGGQNLLGDFDEL